LKLLFTMNLSGLKPGVSSLDDPACFSCAKQAAG
jgi:hypothetical protein